MKKAVKLSIFLLTLVIVSPLIAMERITRPLFKESLFLILSQSLSLIPGKIGSFFRVAFYYGTINQMSTSVTIGFCSFLSKQSVSISNNVSIGAYCIIGSSIINENTMIASKVSIPSGKHQHGTSKNVDCDIENYNKVSIGKNCWVGEGAIVMDDIGNDSIVGAGSVVTRKMPSDSIIVGNPARPLKRNYQDQEIT